MVAPLFAMPAKVCLPFENSDKQTGRAVVETLGHIGADAHALGTTARASLLCLGEIEHVALTRRLVRRGRRPWPRRLAISAASGGGAGGSATGLARSKSIDPSTSALRRPNVSRTRDWLWACWWSIVVRNGDRAGSFSIDRSRVQRTVRADHGHAVVPLVTPPSLHLHQVTQFRFWFAWARVMRKTWADALQPGNRSPPARCETPSPITNRSK
jgi:hypothetical protein